MTPLDLVFVSLPQMRGDGRIRRWSGQHFERALLSDPDLPSDYDLRSVDGIGI